MVRNGNYIKLFKKITVNLSYKNITIYTIITTTITTTTVITIAITKVIITNIVRLVKIKCKQQVRRCRQNEPSLFDLHPYNNLYTNTSFHFRQIIRLGITACHCYQLHQSNLIQILLQIMKSQYVQVKMSKCRRAKKLQVRNLKSNVKNTDMSDPFLFRLAKKAVVRQVILYVQCYV